MIISCEYLRRSVRPRGSCSHATFSTDSLICLLHLLEFLFCGFLYIRTQCSHLVRVMIGKTDFFYPRMIAYHCYLTRNGYPHECLTTPGGHQWYNWEEYCNLFMQRLWK